MSNGYRPRINRVVEVGDIRVTFTQWFWVAEGKIRRVEVVYDARAFLAAPSGT